MLVIFAVAAACSAPPKEAENAANSPETSPSPSPTRASVRPSPAPLVEPDLELQKYFESVAKEAKGRVGVAAVVLETGQNASYNGDKKFAMQSVYKLPIAMALMKQVTDGKLRAEEDVEITPADFVAPGQASLIRDENPEGTKMPLWRVIEYALGDSDGTASDVMLREMGGAEAAQAFLDDAGIRDMTIRNTEKELGAKPEVQYDNYATPLAAVELLKQLQTGTVLDIERAKLLLDFMNESRTGQNRLRGLLPDNAYVAHKTGTSGTRKGVTAATNDIGLILLPNMKFMAIAVFVGDSKADEAAREATIAKIAKAAWDRWGN